jgi:hypothetical protein
MQSDYDYLAVIMSLPLNKKRYNFPCGKKPLRDNDSDLRKSFAANLITQIKTPNDCQ